MTTGADFQQRCRTLAGITEWAVWLLVVGIVFEVVWLAIGKRYFGGGGDDFRTTFHAVGSELVRALPAIFLAFALHSAQRVFERMGKGVVMHVENAKGLVSCGHGVVEAAVAALVVTPTVLAWINREGGVRIDFEWVSVALLLLGLALTLFADVLRDAAAARVELDAIV
jgi:hypothetical protein